MNFTREPVIETIITPREGCKLVVRNSKGVGEDYFVDAVEVVSFGNSFFFRSTEKPKSFLVPVTEYEIIELRETRMVLKTIGIEKSIKIGGGKEANHKHKENTQETFEPKKKEKRRIKKRRVNPEQNMEKEENQTSSKADKEPGKGGDNNDETTVSSSIIRKLFPPPSTLIKEKLSRCKNEDIFDENILPIEIDQAEIELAGKERIIDSEVDEIIKENESKEKPKEEKKPDKDQSSEDNNDENSSS